MNGRKGSQNHPLNGQRSAARAVVRHHLFANPAQLQVGNYEVGQVRGPKIVTTEFSVFKRKSLGSTRSMELRIEMFNMFNHALFSNRNTSFGNSNSTESPVRGCCEIQSAHASCSDRRAC